VKQDLCRVMRGRGVYDTYRPSTKQWLARNDESQPGWTTSRSLTDPNAMLFRYPTNGRGNLEVLVNNQWIDAAAWVRQQAAAAPRPQAQQRPMPAYCPAVRPPFMRENVRQSIPTNNECWTPEEWKWNRERVADIQTGELLRHQRAACEAARASQPYVSRRRGADGVMRYRLSDGSEQPEGGSLNPGWMWTATGPQMRNCI
jgi:hypothetical protein